MTQIFVLSRREIDRSPAMCCLSELENILIAEWQAKTLTLPNVPGNIGSGNVIFCALPAFSEILKVERILSNYRKAGNRIIVYAFDAWDAPAVLYAKRRLLRDAINPAMRLTNIVDTLCLPFRSVIERLSPADQMITRHVPLAVDTSLVDGLNSVRPISVLAYGAQLPKLTQAFALALNNPENSKIFHHTNHLSIQKINDMRLHRLHFWKLAQLSEFSVTFDPSVTSGGRVPIPIVSQRYFESLAAGCVLIGNRPLTEEADELLDWPDAVLDLPTDPELALATVGALAQDKQRIAEIRNRNVQQVRARHDWRHRIPAILAT